MGEVGGKDMKCESWVWVGGGGGGSCGGDEGVVVSKVTEMQMQAEKEKARKWCGVGG